MKPALIRHRLLGIEVDAVTGAGLRAVIEEAIQAGRRASVIAHHNLHSVYLSSLDPKMRAFYEKASVIRIDGMSLVFWGRLLGYSLQPSQRITFVDWVYPLMAAAAQSGWRVFHLGGKEGIAARAACLLRQQYPALQIATHHGYFSANDNPGVLAEISRFQPHLLLVGMGMPRQEHWILDNLDHLQANAILTVGACFDYIAGAIPTPPRWMGRLGLEWLYRLGSEPRRLAARYLLEPWYLIPYAWRDLQQARKRRPCQ